MSNRNLGWNDKTFRCECGEHALFVSRSPDYWEKDDTPEAWFSIVLNRHTLLKRIIASLKYIFANKQPFLDEYLLGPDACRRLIEFIRPIAEWKEPK